VKNTTERSVTGKVWITSV